VPALLREREETSAQRCPLSLGGEERSLRRGARSPHIEAQRGAPESTSPLPVSLLASNSASGNKPLLVRNPSYSRFAQKTLEWSTILSVLRVLTVLRIPGLFPFHCWSSFRHASFITFNQLYAGTGARSRGRPPSFPGVKRRPRTLRGVWERFWDLSTFREVLCARTLCSGFLGLFKPVSWLRMVSLSWEEGLFSSQGGLFSSTPGLKV